MGKMFNLLAFALIVVCIAWTWLSVRKYAARKRLEEERAAAFMAQAVSAMRKSRTPSGKT